MSLYLIKHELRVYYTVHRDSKIPLVNKGLNYRNNDDKTTTSTTVIHIKNVQKRYCTLKNDTRVNRSCRSFTCKHSCFTNLTLTVQYEVYLWY